MPLPWDSVEGQVAVGQDGSFNWYSNGTWHTQAGNPTQFANAPQDAVDGQIAIGSDGGFSWYYNGQWYTAPFQPSTDINSPQDIVPGQVAISDTDDTFHWSPGGRQSYVPPDVQPPEWHVIILVNLYNTGPEQMAMRLCRDDAGGNRPGSIIEASPNFNPPSGVITPVTWVLSTDLTSRVGLRHWLVWGLSTWADGTTSYQMHAVADTGAPPNVPSNAYSWDGGDINSDASWHGPYYPETWFQLTGYNLPSGANGWVGTDVGLTGGFGGGFPAYAQPFIL